VWPVDVKRRIVEESFAPDASVSIVARRNYVNTNQIFTWRQKYRRGELGPKGTKRAEPSPEFVAVGVVASSAPADQLCLPSPAMKASSEAKRDPDQARKKGRKPFDTRQAQR